MILCFYMFLAINNFVFCRKYGSSIFFGVDGFCQILKGVDVSQLESRLICTCETVVCVLHEAIIEVLAAASQSRLLAWHLTWLPCEPKGRLSRLVIPWP